MKKYKVKLSVIDYREAETEIEAESAASAIELAHEMIDSGSITYELQHWKQWKKPIATLIKGKKC